MRKRSRRYLLPLVLGLLIVPLSGCFVVADLLKEQALTSLGFNPDSILAAQGRVLVAFTNQTSGEIAQFSAAVSDQILSSGQLATADFQTLLATAIPAGETRTLVVDCPTGVIVPGTAVVVINNVVSTVTYAGSQLTSGSEFVCGDVIELALVESSTTVTDDQGAANHDQHGSNPGSSASRDLGALLRSIWWLDIRPRLRS